MFYRNSNRESFINRFFNFLFAKSAISRLILINTIVFLLVLLNNLNNFLFNIQNADGTLSGILYYLALPAEISQISSRPWTLITTMFVHAEFWHYFFNMLMLYLSGIIFTRILNEGKIWIAYILGGILGSVFFVFSYNFFPVFEAVLPKSYAIGASAAIMSVLFTISVYAPNYIIRLIFLGSIKLKYIALIFVLLDIFSISVSNPGGHIAHLGGAAFGALYGLFLNKGFKLKPKFSFKRKRKMKANVNENYNKRAETDEEYLSRKSKENKKIDEILDKISKNGYSALTKEEKDFLFKKGQ